MGQPNDNEISLILQPGSKMIFGPWLHNQTQTARFANGKGNILTTMLADQPRVLWQFKIRMSVLDCQHMARFVGETFGLKVIGSESEDDRLCFIFCGGSPGYRPPQQLILDRTRRQIVIVIGDKDIDADLPGAPIDNLAGVADMIATLHGLICRRTELGRTTWHRPDRERIEPNTVETST